jgi:hypothetical protein
VPHVRQSVRGPRKRAKPIIVFTLSTSKSRTAIGKAIEKNIIFGPGTPWRTWISCHAATDTAACAAFIEESRMQFVSATKPNR